MRSDPAIMSHLFSDSTHLDLQEQMLGAYRHGKRGVSDLGSILEERSVGDVPEQDLSETKIPDITLTFINNG